MKIRKVIELGRLRRDEDGHWYLIPFDMVDNFDSLERDIDEVHGDLDKQRELVNIFDDSFSQYRLNNGVEALSVVME